ncbi:5'/3'-nucleotidase SurE [Desulforhopalus singaporensis]|uniref:5'-nucleotidase SurE n=1 Tax=Desulforhopalus singaporensis TaxID=91360 RepID=A0A1H0RVP3_9BACT|nr:5'/3'-nucleotidase SurE [Desulforhopalus singaporensis]SDP33460.1 5'-nucleotidase /3'-nucleotidase /exopolyphosphatase [Desulforhopalus singaporensis]
MKTILITNDDGIHSPGIKALKEAMEKLARTIVIAPDRDNSAVSHSLTMNRPLKVSKLEDNMYTVNGTPTDCVALGIKKILASPPDLLISGINGGANLGDDISYSGTVSAAIEGTMYGIPSIAISVGGEPPFDFRGATRIAAFIAQKALNDRLPENTLLNINVPSGHERYKIRVTRQGRRLWEDSIHETHDPRGIPHYWIGGGTPLMDPSEDTDVYVFGAGCVSITPIQLDLTNHSGISYLKNNWKLEHN